MFLIDVSSSMGNMRIVELPGGTTIEMTHLEWALQFVKLKVQEMVSTRLLFYTIFYIMFLDI
jgi:ATP-dependent DNA helicase 2 subunit 2